MAGRTGLHVGWSNSLGWYEGFCLLISVNPEGVITGFGFAPASTKDQPLAETFFSPLRSLKPIQVWGAWGRRLWAPT
jgi:hypothetical protein